MRETVVITGASAGVGRAVARRFARDGARVVLIARGREGLKAAAAEVEALGGEAFAILADVADADVVERAARRAEQAFGPPDIWINNAMVTVFSPVHRMTAEEFARVTSVTYLGGVHGTMAALRRMRPRGRGTIVQVGSALAYRAIPLQSAYCGAKHALVGFTDSLRTELIHENSSIHVTMVHLPAINTPQFDWARNRLGHRVRPVAPVFEPEVAARAIHFAAHARRREVWVGSSTYKTILGQRVAPGLLDRLVAKLAWSGQMTEQPCAGGPDNLFAPVGRDLGAHGRFAAEAKHSSPLLALTRSRNAWLLAGAASGAALAASLSRR